MSSEKTQNVEISSGGPQISSADNKKISVAIGDAVSTSESVKSSKQRILASSEGQIKVERAQKCLENAALVTKRIKEHRKATAELLGRRFEEDDCGDTSSEITSNISERTSHSVSTDISTTLSLQEALNIPGISENLANTLKQKELLMERIKLYKEITNKKPIIKKPITKRETVADSTVDSIKSRDDLTLLNNTLKDKENVINILQEKMKGLENTIMDLHEKIGEKDMIIEAKTKATSLMSDNLSKKEKDSISLLEDTRQQMTKMQENFIAMESEWKVEKIRLIQEIEEKNEKVIHLEEANTILENSRLEMSLEHSKIYDELKIKNNEVVELQFKLHELSLSGSNNPIDLKEYQSEEEKGSLEIANMVELSKRIEILEQINCQIRQTNKELENKLALSNSEQKVGTSPKKPSPVPARKGGRTTASKVKSPWSTIPVTSNTDTDKKTMKSDSIKLEMVIQSLNKEIIDKEYCISEKNALIVNLRNIISEKESLLESLNNSATEEHKAMAISSSHTERESELSNHINQLEVKIQDLEKQNNILREEVDAANKNMIKVKSAQKTKVKQMQKTIDNFSKISDANSEITKLNEEVHQLTQRVAELEEEKGNLQLHLVDYDSGRLTESDTYKKLVETQALAELRLRAISVLETQKFDLAQELHLLQQKNVEMEDKLADMFHLQSEHVCTEIQSVQLEEQIDALIAQKQQLELDINNLKLNNDHIAENLKKIEIENAELSNKLDHYIRENIELADKLEKLSAEKVSSAESIEIVESLTTQEKIEIEEYNKGVQKNEQDEHKDGIQFESNEIIKKLKDEISELNKKIDLFTLERQEVMEKMNSINSENEILQNQILQLKTDANTFQDALIILDNEKQELQILNIELNKQIEEIKQERLEAMKEAAVLSKSGSTIEDASDNIILDAQTDDRTVIDKGTKGAKSVKQLTKDILKLKSVIKEREAEIADCQMKILSLEEQQQKHVELIETNSSYEIKLKSLLEEKNLLLDELNVLKQNCQTIDNLTESMNQLRQANDLLQFELNNIHLDHQNTIVLRDARINELEIHLLEYENEISTYNNTLQTKDKEMTEYVNQITKLNDVSQKLKSTIECLEEEKAKDQNAEVIKSLNKQMAIYQNTLKDFENKFTELEEEKSKLLSIKSVLESKTVNLDNELKIAQDSIAEKQKLILDLQLQQQKYSDDISEMTWQVKERDEEIHEIKLQLRKESIENEKLRNEVCEKEKIAEIETKKVNELTLKINDEKVSDKHTEMQNKNIELMEKLKKFAMALKKKNTMCAELEVQISDMQKNFNNKEEECANLIKSVSEFKDLNLNLETQLHNLQVEKSNELQQKNIEINNLQDIINKLESKLSIAKEETMKTNNLLNDSNYNLNKYMDENNELKIQIEEVNKKLIDFEIEQKNNSNYLTKIQNLESELHQKQIYVTELSNKIVFIEENHTQNIFGYTAKLQERDMYIENLELEISKYKGRIGRLEDSISEMEDRRHSLERKADQLDIQLQDKYNAYHEYSNQEDELINRLAVLMDHDRVVEKQLHEIEKDNKELQIKLQDINEVNIKLKKNAFENQEKIEILSQKATKYDLTEVQLNECYLKIQDLENYIQKLTSEHQNVIFSKLRDIEDIETEFNTQIENAIKEKKVLSEKYEKVNEHVCQLEQKLLEYKSNINNLNINIEEITKLNYELSEKSNQAAKYSSKDYTDQYINEINSLNSIINTKNREITELNEYIAQLQVNSSNIILSKQSEIEQLNIKLVDASTNMSNVIDKMEHTKYENIQLNEKLYNTEKQLMEKKTMTFEMNIPKTEGMVISSTIEQLNTDPLYKPSDLCYIDSQIITDTTDSKDKDQSHEYNVKKNNDGSQVDEPTIVSKKAYLCYVGPENAKIDENIESDDPFSSHEGWGFEDNASASNQALADISSFNEQILNLKKEKEKLQTELDSSNTKITKALKKIKDLKSSNEVLSNELKLSKQSSEPTLLDSAIEDALQAQIHELNEKIHELQTQLSSEKRDIELCRKRNDDLKLTNNKLTNIKEKLDNEIELWKFKFREVNDKMSSMQWDTEPKENISNVKFAMSDNNEEVIKLDKENEELIREIDEIKKQNDFLNTTLSQLQNEMLVITSKSLSKCNNCDNLKEVVKCLKNENQELYNEKETSLLKLADITKEVQLKQTQIDTISQQKNAEFSKLNESYEIVLSDLRNCRNSITNLTKELLESAQKVEVSKTSKAIDYNDDYKIIQDEIVCLRKGFQLIKIELNKANAIIIEMENNKQELDKAITLYQNEIEQLNKKIHQLDTENDQLLSSVTELRSSVSGAVDQRGYEIAEMWKQHLAQREAEFASLEHELREQLNASELKYEQLLDNMQSSNQDETNKLVAIEQSNSLQNKLKDKEEHLVNLQNKYTDLINQMELLRSELEDEKIIHENKLLSQQEDYEKQLLDLSTNEKYKNEVLQLQSELHIANNNNIINTETITELRLNITNLESEIAEMKNLIANKDAEIYQKACEYTITNSQKTEEFESIKQQIINNYNTKVEEANHEKESELASMRLKNHENMSYYEDKIKHYEIDNANLIDSLTLKENECVNLHKNIAEYNLTLEENSTKITEMQSALENQEYEIVTLKDDISNLEEILKLSTTKVGKHVTFASDTKPGTEELSGIGGELNKELLDAVPRAELDLALYMLHQRDVRCEELTMELTHLLDERDTLQLRLSDSIRSYEDLKNKFKLTGFDMSTSSQETIPETPVLVGEREQSSGVADVHKASSRSSSVSEGESDKPRLQAKLSELRSVRHSRDVRLRSESEQRDFGMRLLQRDVAMLPPEAAEQLRQAHHTLSRDSQSTSTVLLNWLRGKSTPKVVDM